MVDFMEDMLRVMHWYLDPKNHDEVAKIASKITKAPPERFGWLFTKQDTYRDPNMMPDLDALQHNVDTVKDLGFVKKHDRHQETRRPEPGEGSGRAAEKIDRQANSVRSTSCASGPGATPPGPICWAAGLRPQKAVTILR